MILSWILSALLLGAVMVLGGATANRIAERFRAPRRWIVVGTMALLVIVPLLLGFRSHPAASAGAALLRGAAANRTSSPARPPESPTDTVILAIWSALSLVVGSIFVASHRRTVAELKCCPSRRLHEADVLLSPRFGPAVVGFIRPRMVIPEWTLDLPIEEQRLVVRHEAEHLRAGDPGLVFAGALMVVLMPWNVALWWQFRRLRIAIEMDCDARVAPDDRDRPGYARLLMQAREAHPGRPIALALVPPPSALAERLLALLEQKSASRGQMALWVAATVGCTLAATRVPVPDLTPLFAPPARAEVVPATGPGLIPGAVHMGQPRTATPRAVAAGRRIISASARAQRFVAPDSTVGPAPVATNVSAHPRYDSLVPYVPMARSGRRGMKVDPGVGRATPPSGSVPLTPDAGAPDNQ